VSKDEKLLQRLLSRPKDINYNELRRLLKSLGYVESTGGKTSGSRVAFIETETKHIIRLHKPHPGNELKTYQVDLLIDELRSRGLV
jgi:hypothetical protein